MSIDSWGWRPGKSVGPFRFGSDATPAIERFGLRKLEPDCAGAYWDTYEIPGHESRISTEDGKISSVNCWDSLHYQGLDILRLDLDRVRSMLGPEEGAEPVGEDAIAVYYNSLGLTLWIYEGRIESTTCEAESGQDQSTLGSGRNGTVVPGS
jgi:hypothetical protein